MPRILHLFNIFGALTEKAMLDYTLGLVHHGWAITAGYETLAEDAPQTSLPALQLQRIHVQPTDDIPAQMQQIAAQVTDPAMQRLLDDPPRLVHGHFGPRLLQAAAFLRHGIPAVISLYGYDVGRLLRDPCWIERYRWAAQQGVTFVPLAQAMFDRLVELGLPRQRLELIRLGIHLDEHRFDPRPAPAVPRFVFIGRFVPKKAPQDLITAMGRLVHELHVPARLDLIGAGPMEEQIRRMIDELRLTEHVRLVGLVPFAQLFDWLHDATALVQPSAVAPDGDAEGAPMVLMHAQAAGVPCVTTRHSGNPEVLPPQGQGFVVAEHDTAGLAEAMRRISDLTAEERLSLQQAGRAWIEEHYTLAQTVGGYDGLYRAKLGLEPQMNAAQ